MRCRHILLILLCHGYDGFAEDALTLPVALLINRNYLAFAVFLALHLLNRIVKIGVEIVAGCAVFGNAYLFKGLLRTLEYELYAVHQLCPVCIRRRALKIVEYRQCRRKSVAALSRLSRMGSAVARASP